MKFIIFIIFVFILFSRCKEVTNEPFVKQFRKEVNINLCDINSLPSDSIGNPIDIYSFGNSIVLVEPEFEKILTLYNIKDQAIRHLQKKGRGPEELIYITQVNNFNDSSFYVYDPFSMKMGIYHIKGDSIISEYKKMKENISANFWNPSMSLKVLKGNTQKFYLHDPLKDIAVRFGEPLNLGGHSEETLANLEGICVNSFIRNRIAWFSYLGDIFEIYDFSEINNCKLIKREIAIPPMFKEKKIKDKKVLAFSPKTKLGVSSLTSNDQYIYVLYNSHYIKDEIEKKDNAYLSNKILVYDWDGNPIKLLKLNKAVSCISYNAYHKCFYCLSHNEHAEPIIVKFQLEQ